MFVKIIKIFNICVYFGSKLKMLIIKLLSMKIKKKKV